MALKRISVQDMRSIRLAAIRSFNNYKGFVYSSNQAALLKEAAVEKAQLESVDLQLEADLKAHNAVIREIREGLMKLIGDDIYNIYEKWQEFWPKYGGE